MAKSEHATHPGLEAEILANPDSNDAWAVYGDWLSSRGDPRGELVAIQRARAGEKGAELGRLLCAEAALLEAHAKHFYGPLARSPRARQTHVDWADGFVCALDASGFGSVDAFFAHPSAKFVRRLSQATIGTPPPLLESVSTAQRSVASLLAHAPLREIALTGYELELENVRHPALERLAIEYATPDVLRALADADLPRLRELSLGHVSQIEAALPAIERLPAASLSLGIESGHTSLGPVADRITTLVLHGAHVVDFAALAAHAFRAVHRLVVTSFDAVVDFFERGPELAALRRVDLAYPSDSVRFFRGFVHTEYARRIQHLVVSVRKPGAGRALVERAFGALEQLDLSFDPTLSAEFLESTAMLSVDAFPSVRCVSLRPGKHVAGLAASPMAARIVELRLDVDEDRDAALFLEHRDRFERLESLVVGGVRRLRPESVLALCSAVPEVEWAPRVSPV